MSDEIEIKSPRDVIADVMREREGGYKKVWLENTDHAIAALTEAGYAIVPREPRVEMVVAGYESVDWFPPAMCRTAYDRAADIWRATRPQAPPDSPIPGKATDAAKNAQGAPAATGGDSSAMTLKELNRSLFNAVCAARPVVAGAAASWGASEPQRSRRIGILAEIDAALAQTIDARRGETEGLDAQRESVTAEPMRQRLQRDTASEAGW